MSRQGVSLRVLTGSRRSEVITLSPGRTTIGSSLRCTLRIAEPGVEPLHCLIVCDGEGLTARSWASSAMLNGRPFVESHLAVGDVLSIGESDFEIVSPSDVEEYWTQEVASTIGDVTKEQEQGHEAATGARAGRHDTRCLDESSADKLSVDERGPARESMDTADAAMVPAAAVAEVFRQLQSANEVARGRSRKLLAALREDRNGHRTLVSRIDELEQCLRDALSEREFAISGLHASSGRAAEYEASLKRLDEIPSAEFRVPTIDEWNGVVEAHVRLSDEIEQLVDAQRRIVDEVVALSQDTTDLESRFESTERCIADWRSDLTELREGLATWKSLLAEGAGRGATSEGELSEPCAEGADARDVSRKTVPIWSLSRALIAAKREDMAVNPGAENTVAATELIAEEPVTALGNSEMFVGQAGQRASDDPGERNPHFSPARDEASDQTVQAVAEEPSADAPEATDPEVAIAHLRELSIWKQADGASLADKAVPPPAELPAAQSQNEDSGKKESPPSFIERYAHLFSGDEAAAEEPMSRDASPAPGFVDLLRGPEDGGGARPLAEGAGTPRSDAEEESIEAYMMKLLQRVRGESASCGASAALQSGATNISDASSLAGEGSASPLEDGSAAEIEPEVSPGPLRDVQEMKRREPVPEHSTDLEALRDLANESARRAIGTHASRVHRRAALRKVIIALVAGMMSLLLMLLAPGWSDPQFIVACASLMVAAYWAGQSYGAVVQSIRAGSYDGPEPYGAGHSLPIDVDHRR